MAHVERNESHVLYLANPECSNIMLNGSTPPNQRNGLCLGVQI